MEPKMGIDENEEANSSSTQNEEQPTPAAKADEGDKDSRVDAAKAFFRAMYAGEEPPPETKPAAPPPKQETTKATACRKCDQLEFSLKEAEQRAAESDTLYKRMAADFENFRKRNERERDEALAIGVKKAAEGVMPALDDLDRAMSFLNPDTPSDKVIESFQLVANRILSCFESIGLKRINALGELFDPRFHEPVQQIETTEHPDGTVIQELRKGYMLNDKVVRPALVNVASNSETTFGGGPAEEEQAGEKSEEELVAAAEEGGEYGTEAEAEGELHELDAEGDPEERVLDFNGIEGT
jgi:molecular chaperone GrpE